MSTPLRAGYKQTEVGVIPEDWESATVNSLAASVRNAIVGGPFGSDLVSRDYVDDGVPVIRGQNMGRRWLEGPYVFVTQKKAGSLEANLARPGDVLFTQRGTLGQVSLAPETPYRRYLVSQSQMKVTLNGNITDPNFFLCWFVSEGGQKTIRLNTIQTGVPHINLGILRSLPVPIPPFPEQRAIAEALINADALIESLEQLITKKHLLKQGAMQDLLTGKKRLPGFSGERMLKQLGELCDMKSGTSITSTNIDDYSEFPCYGGNGLRGYTGAYTHDGNYALIGRQGALCGNVVIVGGRFFASEHAIVVTPMKNTDIRWLALVLTRMNLNQFSESSAQPGLSISKLLVMSLTAPPLPEQAAIGAILRDMDAEIVILEEQLAKARSIKHGMMHKLLSGEIRLR